MIPVDAPAGTHAGFGLETPVAVVLDPDLRILSAPNCCGPCGLGPDLLFPEASEHGPRLTGQERKSNAGEKHL